MLNLTKIFRCSAVCLTTLELLRTYLGFFENPFKERQICYDQYSGKNLKRRSGRKVAPALLITICICDVTLSSTHVEQTVLTVAINNAVKRFLLYINDIQRSSKNLTTLTCYLFADGANLLYAGNNLQSLERNINTELRYVKFTNG